MLLVIRYLAFFLIVPHPGLDHLPSSLRANGQKEAAVCIFASTLYCQFYNISYHLTISHPWSTLLLGQMEVNLYKTWDQMKAQTLFSLILKSRKWAQKIKVVC